MNIIKKNILLVAVLAITLILAGVLIFFVIKATGTMKNSATAVEDLRKKINELNEQSPAPVKKNLDRILNDQKMIAKKVKDIQPIFGIPYKEPLERFAQELNKDVAELKKEWKKRYRIEIKKGGHRSLIFVKYLSTFDSTKMVKALEAFASAVNKNSLEIINETNINGSIMEALGLPRKMDEISCKQHIRDMQIDVVNYMKTLKKPNDSKEIPFTFKDETVEKLSFEKYDDAMPRPDEVPFIFKHWKMIEDVFVRLKTSGISYLESIKRDNLLKGTTVAKQYLVFSYTLKIKGSQNAVRAFLNSLMDAHKDDKIYIIRSLSLESTDDAASILAGKADPTAVKARTRGIRRGGRRPEQQQPEKEEVEEDLEVNVPLMGVSNTVTAEISFDYVIFIGNEIRG
jgi:hypothetical protein